MALPLQRTGGPNILITGTPGTGKSTLAKEVADQTGLIYINVGAVAKDNDYYDGYDEKLHCHILDEDPLLDDLEERLGEKGGHVVDYHHSDFFPERWFDIVFVLRADNSALHQRYTNRGYSSEKIQQNMQCEIFGTIAEETKESYAKEIVHELPSNTVEDMDNNCERIVSWINANKE